MASTSICLLSSVILGALLLLGLPELVRAELPTDVSGGSEPQAADVALVAQDSAVADDRQTISLRGALADPWVSRIIVVGNYSVHQDFVGYVGAPLVISRNLTITGLQGKDTVLDLDFQKAKVELASNSTLILNNITIANERRGTGTQYDLFLGESGSRVIVRDVNKLRMACTSHHHLADVVSHTPRSKLFAGEDRKQSFEFVNITYHGRTYHDMLELLDYTTDVPRTLQEGAPPFGGYALSETNTVRLCQQTILQDCIDRAGADYCVNRAIDDMQHESPAATPAVQDSIAGTGPDSHPPSRTTTAVMVAVAVVTGALGTLAVLGLALWIRHRHRRKPELLSLPSSGTKSLADSRFGGRGSDGSAAVKDIEAGIDTEASLESDVWQPSGMRKGWQVANCITTPLLGSADDDDKIQFGRLLGCGSFGRVYLAKWAGRQCAVKVITHGADTTPVVENEVALMMSFNHINIVKAYRCITYTHAPSSKGRGSTAAGASTAGSTAEGSNNSNTLRQVTDRQESRGLMKATGIIRKQSSFRGGQLVRAPSNAASCGSPTVRCTGSPAAGTSPTAATPKSAVTASAAPKSPITQQAELSKSDDTGAIGRSSPTAGCAAAGSGQARGSLTDGEHCDHTAGTGGTCSSGFDHDGTDVGSTDIEDANRAETWLVQEYCDSGTLSSITSKWQALPTNSDEWLVRLLTLLRDTARGLEELHKANVVHGDLNARNVLVSSSHMAQYGHIAKIADLGLSRTVRQHQTHRTTNTVGTMSHMPPELLRYGRMSSAADVYAFGIMMWELYTGQQAFRRLHYGQFFDIVVRHNLRPSIPDHTHSDYRTLMEHCWATEPADRPTASSIVECLDYMIQERELQLQHRGPSPGQPTGLASNWATADVRSGGPGHGSAENAAANAATDGEYSPVRSQLQSLLAASAAGHAVSKPTAPKPTAAAAGGLDDAVSREMAEAGPVGASDASKAASLGSVMLASKGQVAAAGAHGVQTGKLLPRHKPQLLSQPAPGRRPRISFGYYGAPVAAAAALPAAVAAAAAAAGNDDLAPIDARQLYLPIDEASAAVITPTAATPACDRGHGIYPQGPSDPDAAKQAAEGSSNRRFSLGWFNNLHSPTTAAPVENHRLSFSLLSPWHQHTSAAAGEGRGRHPSFSLFGDKGQQAAAAGGNGSRRSSLNLFTHWPGHIPPLFRSQTAEDRRSSSYSRRGSIENGLFGESGCQLSEPLPTSFSYDREDSQVLKRFWFI